MREVVLPEEIRQCPVCSKHGFQARKAGLGGSWGGGGIRFLYVCSQCDHREVIECASSRRSTALSGFTLGLLGVAMGFLLEAPGNSIIALLLIGLGGYAFWAGQFALARHAPVVGAVKKPRLSVPVEESLYVSAEEEAKGAVRNRQTAYLIYGIAGLTLFYCLYELFWLA
ncbi:hypothetical protein [Cohaesibacter intestini]|uniref:hypothetical protein n=1 Tax=Cohaesibacter intestini TaxID=2211145 RepID=UPI000DEA2065|nr:hypothetical protein [Cohaesibacter intestini]